MARSPIGRRWVLDAHDGVMTTTALVQGFAGAGASQNVVVFAAAALMVSGGLAVGASAYSEIAQERAAQVQLIAEEQDDVVRDPATHEAFLRAHYVRRGLASYLADIVARQLMTRDALGANLEAEFGIIAAPPPRREAWWAALRALLGYMTGALPIALFMLFFHGPWRAVVIIGVATLLLALTGMLSAISGGGNLRAAVVRSVGTGLFVAIASYLAGLAFELLDTVVPEIEVSG
ncbi:VIT1/CCC1 transporter family protein [Microbacterium gorillae]|uniref:VIT1/CCC1 transporter family protein n=1 Tax=Microbacterium gorillae TaxID=1231063 RepID=UPI0006936AC7|nr:VIT1/CCC1 transporter family protein [Microbacterium gorillae]